MKIAIASSSLPPGFGISVYVDEISKCLYRQGHQVMVFVTDTRDLSSETYEYPVHLTKIPISSKNHEYDLIRQFYEAVINFGPDAILISDCIYASNILPSLPPECIRASVVHGYRPGFGFDGHRLITSAAIHNYDCLDWIIGTSKHMCLGLNKYYRISSEMIKLVYNGINPHQTCGYEMSDNIDNSKKTILFAGGSNPTKGCDVFLKAVKILTKSNSMDWKIIWIGGADSPPNALKKSGLLHKVIDWKGMLPLASLREILSHAHVLAMPSKAEACPMLLIDGLSMGAVPVVSDCPSAMMEIVNDAQCGLVSKAGNAEDLANCFSHLLTRPKTMIEMSIRGKEYFHKNLTIDNTCTSLLSLLTTRRNDFRPRYAMFPSGKIYPNHRKKYKYSKWHPLGIYERFKLIFGILPSELKY